MIRLRLVPVDKFKQEPERVESRTLEIHGLIVHFLRRVECAEIDRQNAKMHGQKADSRPGCK
jgi:hypothetical protein